MSDPRTIILKPIVTEKGTSLMEQNKYLFRVDKKANKSEIKKAVETLFKVKVIDVNTMTVPGKTKRVGRHIGQTSDWKKAIVKIAEGNRIEFFEGV
jgi:large subunit ribosomal protein L23